jgi:hypothetical protein
MEISEGLPVWRGTAKPDFVLQLLLLFLWIVSLCCDVNNFYGNYIFISVS